MTKSELLKIIQNCSDDMVIKLSDNEGTYECMLVSVTSEITEDEIITYIVLG